MLKSLCFFLAFCVMLLSVNPCYSDNDYTRDFVAKNEVSSKTPLSDKDCQGCSPFFTCGTRAGLILTTPSNHHLQIIAETDDKHYSDYRQPYIRQVLISVWPPPKLS